MAKTFLSLLALLVLSPSPAVSGRNSLKTDKVAVVAGNSEFAFDLYANLREKPGNLLFSPESISTALAMTYAGARGETAEQMARTLHYTLEQERLHPAFHALIEELSGGWRKRGYELRIANALWGQHGFGFLPHFLKVTKVNYGAGFHEVDFPGDTEGSRRTINAWVEKETKQKIKELLKPGILDANTRLVLTNAIYFKGDWDRKFDKAQTREEAFHVSAEKKTQVPMMHQTVRLKYLDGGTFQALEMPYQGKELSMVVLLPKKVDGLAAFEKTLTASKLAEWLPKMHPLELDVALPRFKTTSEFSLADTLSAMGMPLAFTPRLADFSGMNGERNLFIKAVVHKGFVAVNEEGSEAAASTGVTVELEAAPLKKKFRADHPFGFLIRDNRSGSILFLGRMAYPPARAKPMWPQPSAWLPAVKASGCASSRQPRWSIIWKRHSSSTAWTASSANWIVRTC